MNIENKSVNKNWIDSISGLPTLISKEMNDVLNVLLKKQDEYSKYLRFLIKAFTNLMVTARSFFLTIPLIGVELIFLLINMGLQKLSNQLTDNAIKDAVTNYSIDYPGEYQQLIKQLREKSYLDQCNAINLMPLDDKGKAKAKEDVYARIYDKDDASWLKFYQQKNPGYSIDNEIIETGLNQLKFMAHAFFNAIATQRTSSTISKYLLVVAAFVIMPLTAVLQVIQKIIIEPIDYILHCVANGIILVTLAIFTAPLYVKDYITSKWNNANVSAATLPDLTHSPNSESEIITLLQEPSVATWKDILEYGRWAPSPHNMQPWLFRIESESTVTLMYDPKRLLPGTNPSGSFMMVGFGILNEILSIAAAAHGLDIDVNYITEKLDPRTEGPQALATLTLVPRKSKETLDSQLILDRQTSRLPYDGKPVSSEILTELSDIAACYGHKFEFSSEQAQVDWVVRLNADTMFFDMSETVARNEVASWIRFSKSDAKMRKDGLAAYAMNVSGILMWLFVHANWIFRLPGIYQLVRQSYERSMQGTATVAWLSGPFENQLDWDRAGHMMARLWLTMTKYGIYLHPFGSVITNSKARDLMTSHFKSDMRQHDLWMLLRLGYGEAPPKAQRMPLSKMMVRGGLFFSPANDGAQETATTTLQNASNGPR